MATDKRPTMLRLNDTMYEKIRYIAYYEHRSINAQIEQALEIYIKNFENQNGSIQLPNPSEEG